MCLAPRIVAHSYTSSLIHFIDCVPSISYFPPSRTHKAPRCCKASLLTGPPLSVQPSKHVVKHIRRMNIQVAICIKSFKDGCVLEKRTEQLHSHGCFESIVFKFIMQNECCSCEVRGHWRSNLEPGLGSAPIILSRERLFRGLPSRGLVRV